MTKDECIVHGNRYVSRFQSTLKQLRREKKFHAGIYQQLPLDCCSCNNNEGTTHISIDNLEQLCRELLMTWSTAKGIAYTKNLNKLIMNQKTKGKKWKKSKAAREEMQLFLDGYPDEYFCDYLEDSSGESSGVHYDVKSQLPISLKYFQPRTVLHSCIVHDLRYVSHFSRAVRALKTVSDFSPRIYHELVKECCSCDGREGIHHIDPILLRSLCYEIEEEIDSKPCTTYSVAEPSGLLVLPSTSPMLNPDEYRRRIGILIGKRGRHLSEIQTKFNVRINVVTNTSSAILQRRLKTILELPYYSHRYNRNNVYILFDPLDVSISKPIETGEIKQLLRQRWTNISNA